MRPGKLPALRRTFPDVVTADPADDDAEVYGEAWPLVAEWRKLQAGHPDGGRSVRWLETEKRILTLELAMLDEHGLTLPPETQPLRGFARKGQTGWRKTALYDTQRALVWAKLRRWVRRFLTLGLCYQKMSSARMSRGKTLVLVMQPAQDRPTHDLALAPGR